MKFKTTSILAVFVCSAATPAIAADVSACQTEGRCAGKPVAPALQLISTEGDQPAAAHEAHAARMLEGYASVSTALYQDDLAAAKKAAADMVKHDKDSAMAKPAQAIADSKTLEEARKHFKELSEVAIPIAKANKVMHVAHCPMAAGGKGADWLQESADEVQNPYMGAKMPHCGAFMK